MSRDPEEETKANTWIEKETVKNPKTKNQSNSEKSIVSDTKHRTGTNNMTPSKNKEMPKLQKNQPLREFVPNQTKIGPEDKTQLSGIRSNQRRRGRRESNDVLM